MQSTQENNITILIIDDEPPILEVIRGYLKEITCNTLEAQTKKEAWDLFNKHKVDVVIADVRLTNKESGLDLAEEMLKKNNSIPIIILTSHDDKDIILQALRIGVVDYLTKPIDYAFFQTRVREAILKRQVNLAQDSIIETLHETLKLPKEKCLQTMTPKERIIYIQELVTIAAIKTERES